MKLLEYKGYEPETPCKGSFELIEGGKHYPLADLLENLEEGGTLPTDEAFENAPPVGKEAL